jgi:hypothetical protein
MVCNTNLTGGIFAGRKLMILYVLIFMIWYIVSYMNLREYSHVII